MTAKTLKVIRVLRDNDNDAFIPEMWAQESLMVLEANTIMANLVHRDFENEIAEYGDTVNTRRPGTFEAIRKTDADEVTVQDASATKVAVKLDQHIHVSFTIKDGEASKSFKNLVAEYLVPALSAEGQSLDQMLIGQLYQFPNSVGKLGTSVDRGTVVDIREALNTQLAPMAGRNMIIPPSMEGALLDVADFVSAEKIGGSSLALREAELGRLFGLQTYLCQNAPTIADDMATRSYTVNGALAVGATTVPVNEDLTGVTDIVGAYCVIAGDATPQLITAAAVGSGTSALTISPGLKSAVLTTAAVTVTRASAINYGAGYSAAYGGLVTVDAFSNAIKPVQAIAIDADPDQIYSTYGNASLTTTTMRLDRPLDSAVADGVSVGRGPAGNYGFAFHRNAIALVTRPLIQPMAGTGVRSYVASHNGLSVRVTISYEPRKQGHLVTVDMLAGIKVLDENLGVVIYG